MPLGWMTRITSLVFPRSFFALARYRKKHTDHNPCFHCGILLTDATLLCKYFFAVCNKHVYKITKILRALSLADRCV